MRLFKTKKRTATMGSLLVAAAVAAAAYAFFTTGGSGSGTALSGDAAGGTNVVLQVQLQSDFGGPHLIPGGADPIAIAAWNTGVTDLMLHSVTLAHVTDPGGAAGCISYLAAHQADWTMTPGTVTENTIIPAATSSGSAVPLAGATLNWLDNPAIDQSPCADSALTVTLNWT
jgi:hypothetical protein